MCVTLCSTRVVYFNIFTLFQNVRSYTIKKQVADDYYDLYVTQLVFRKFREAMEIVRKENEMKWQMAVIYYNRFQLYLLLLKRFRNGNVPYLSLSSDYIDGN